MYNSFKCEVPVVDGENGANSYPLPPDSSVLLLDKQDPIVWFKSTDSGGFANVKGFSITPIKTKQEEIDDNYNDLDQRLKRIEEMLNEQSNIRNVKRNTTKHNHKQSDIKSEL